MAGPASRRQQFSYVRLALLNFCCDFLSAYSSSCNSCGTNSPDIVSSWLSISMPRMAVNAPEDVEGVLRSIMLQAKLAKVVLPFTLLAVYVVWMQSRSDRVVRLLVSERLSRAA